MFISCSNNNKCLIIIKRKYLIQQSRLQYSAKRMPNSVQCQYLCRIHYSYINALCTLNLQALHCRMLHLDALFVVLYFIKVENFALIIDGLWPRGLRCGCAAARLLRLWVQIPLGAWKFFCCDWCVLSGRGLCDELITRPEQSYRLWCVVVCDLETS